MTSTIQLELINLPTKIVAIEAPYITLSFHIPKQLCQFGFNRIQLTSDQKLDRNSGNALRH